jgi:hypothetical protein
MGFWKNIFKRKKEIVEPKYVHFLKYGKEDLFVGSNKPYFKLLEIYSILTPNGEIQANYKLCKIHSKKINFHLISVETLGHLFKLWKKNHPPSTNNFKIITPKKKVKQKAFEVRLYYSPAGLVYAIKCFKHKKEYFGKPENQIGLAYMALKDLKNKFGEFL